MSLIRSADLSSCGPTFFQSPARLSTVKQTLKYSTPDYNLNTTRSQLSNYTIKDISSLINQDFSNENSPPPPYFQPIRESSYEDHEPMTYDFKTYEEYFKHLNAKQSHLVRSYKNASSTQDTSTRHSNLTEVSPKKNTSYGFKFSQLEPITHYQGRALAYYYLHSHHMDIVPAFLNGLRRTALTFLGGGAFTALRIPNMKHEFYAIAGVREQFFEIAQNLRHITLKNVPKTANFTNPMIAHLRVKGPLSVVAGHLQLPQPVQLISPNQPICNVAAGNYLEMDVKIEYIENWVMPEWGFESLERDIDDTNFIHFASSVSPVEKFCIHTRRRATDLDTLGEISTVEVHTDGTKTPRSALLESTNILLRQISQINWALHKNCKIGIDGTIEDEFEDEDVYLDEERFPNPPWKPYKTPKQKHDEAKKWIHQSDVIRQYPIDPESSQAKEELAKEWKQRVLQKKNITHNEKPNNSIESTHLIPKDFLIDEGKRAIEPSKWVLENPFKFLTEEDFRGNEDT